jgi:broad specificity phosphatase PhoE
MSTLLLIRHAQARAFDADSDKLTERGVEQGKQLGAYLVRAGIRFDEVHMGTLERQRHTAELVGHAFTAAGQPWPAAAPDASWNEYDAGGILGTLLPRLTEQDDRVRLLADEFRAAAERPDRNRYFQRLFEAVMDAWQNGEIRSEAVEPFSAFHARVATAFRAMTSRGGNRRVALFTSGGPIGVCMQEALEAPPRAALRLNWRVKNCSLTEILFSEGRISLDSFNVAAHLPPELQTFR